MKIMDLLHRMHTDIPFENILRSIHTYYSTEGKANDDKPRPPPPDLKGRIPTFLIEGHPDFLPSFHTFETDKYVRKHRIKRNFEELFEGTDYSYRDNLERKITYVFINQGYGLNLTKQVLGEEVFLSLNSARTTFTTVCLQACSESVSEKWSTFSKISVVCLFKVSIPRRRLTSDHRWQIVVNG
jgi:hypothetical protein